ncbi:DUF2530 domain-containing protein [Frankia sp. CcI156]|uniref:DUF2530 domain-containing protein n=1 Tax=Frankia casuarinae (strain DSM 45818 / CECT 9043 / HFP020203 / CcI3) TaxID=106370 RepID=Q2JGV7_FRACC|nr:MULTISPECIES: DUF2530 domain-containing protein [Frankia]ABD09485.1 hypothetical protein Francci3_0091 [Frankia casuarinae]ETA02818.1 hypothetical protein CcI6DRAFT_01778 [Frankia sp. CcI6]EYT94109.1 hypothetical protein ThrDRAFT_00033 [Frankia casuarinae]KFB06746.1 hypothetical protein ALLO2DRAFT_00032 [Frankia sp. Allo2]OAA21403.1 Protein of unknown function (DUF2530) [Frankia casuarinae]
MSVSASSDSTGGAHAPEVPPVPEGGEPAATTRPSAPEPLPYDGVASVAVGTVLWAIAALVMAFFLDELRGDGRLWWFATAICGFVLGLAGLWIVIRRRNRLRARGNPDHADR